MGLAVHQAIMAETLKAQTRHRALRHWWARCLSDLEPL
jgi:hypothetical protein